MCAHDLALELDHVDRRDGGGDHLDRVSASQSDDQHGVRLRPQQHRQQAQPARRRVLVRRWTGAVDPGLGQAVRSEAPGLALIEEHHGGGAAHGVVRDLALPARLGVLVGPVSQHGPGSRGGLHEQQPEAGRGDARHHPQRRTHQTGCGQRYQQVQARGHTHRVGEAQGGQQHEPAGERPADGTHRVPGVDARRSRCGIRLVPREQAHREREDRADTERTREQAQGRDQRICGGRAGAPGSELARQLGQPIDGREGDQREGGGPDLRQGEAARRRRGITCEARRDRAADRDAEQEARQHRGKPLDVATQHVTQ